MKAKPNQPSRRVNYWKACELIGEAKAARIWGEADADQEELLSIVVPSDSKKSGTRGR